jgi:hypothetical protein
MEKLKVDKLRFDKVNFLKLNKGTNSNYTHFILF